jgi:hypothetical protein
MVGSSAGFKTALIADLRLPLAAYLKTDVPIVTHTAAAGTPEAGKLEFPARAGAIREALRPSTR